MMSCLAMITPLISDVFKPTPPSCFDCVKDACKISLDGHVRVYFDNSKGVSSSVSYELKGYRYVLVFWYILLCFSVTTPDGLPKPCPPDKVRTSEQISEADIRSWTRKRTDSRTGWKFFLFWGGFFIEKKFMNQCVFLLGLIHYFKGGPEPLEKESHEFLDSKRDDQFANPFFEMVQKICQGSFFVPALEW